MQISAFQHLGLATPTDMMPHKQHFKIAEGCMEMTEVGTIINTNSWELLLMAIQPKISYYWTKMGYRAETIFLLKTIINFS